MSDNRNFARFTLFTRRVKRREPLNPDISGRKSFSGLRTAQFRINSDNYPKIRDVLKIGFVIQFSDKAL